MKRDLNTYLNLIAYKTGLRKKKEDKSEKSKDWYKKNKHINSGIKKKTNRGMTKIANIERAELEKGERPYNHTVRIFAQAIIGGHYNLPKKARNLDEESFVNFLRNKRK